MNPNSCGVTATSHERDFYGWVEQLQGAGEPA